MEKKQITKKQHYVSQGLLRLFSNDSTHIYECLISDEIYEIHRPGTGNELGEA